MSLMVQKAEKEYKPTRTSFEGRAIEERISNTFIVDW